MKQILQRSWWRRVLVLAAVLIVFIGAYFAFGRHLTLQELANREAALRALGEERPLAMLGGAFLIYVVVTGLSLPGSVPLTIAYAWFFGFWQALVLVSFASTAGATVAFLLSRYLFRDTIQRSFGDYLTKFNERIEREGAFYLFTLRMLPAVPFLAINLVMGLTPLRTWTYWWVSQLGMLPGTCVYLYAGQAVPSLQELADGGVRGIVTAELIVAFALLGLFPLVVKKLFDRIRGGRGE